MKGNYPPELIEEIRERTDIVQLIESYIPLKRRGRNYVALCPFHLEDTPSFSVNPERQWFHCFGCQKGGDVITFVREIDHLSFTEAVEKLAHRAGVALPEREMSPREKQLYDERRRLWAVNDATAVFFRQALTAESEAARYLDRRGVDPAMRERFRLGYATAQWDDLKNYLLQKGFGEQEMVKAGVVSRGDNGRVYDRFRQRLMFPICDYKGNVIAFGGRVLDDSLPKYLNSAENPLFHKGRNLYGLDLAIPSIRQQGEAAIVEGYLDVITAHQYGITNVVAPLGTAFTAEQAETLMRYTDSLLLAYDGDKAGRKAAFASMDILAARAVKRVAVMLFPDGRDPDEFLRAGGREAWDTLRAKAPAAMEFRMETALAAHDNSRAEGKADIVAELTPALRAIRSTVERTEYIRTLARRLDLDADLLLNDIRRQQPPTLAAASRPRRESGDSGPRRAAAYICRYCVEHENAFDEVEKNLGWDFVTDPRARQVIELIRGHRAEFGWSFNDLPELAQSDEERAVISAFAVSGGDGDGDDRDIFRDCVQTIRRESQRQKLKELENALRDPTVQQDREESARLLTEICRIQQELRK